MLPGLDPVKKEIVVQNVTTSHEPRRAGWTRRCPLCGSAEITFAEKGALSCSSCSTTLPAPHGSPRATWESDLRRFDRYDAPARFSIADYKADEDGGLAAEVRTRQARVAHLDRAIRKEGVAALGRNPSQVEVALVGALCMLLWNAARAAAGCHEAVVDPAIRRDTVFGGVRHALREALEGATTLGTGPTYSPDGAISRALPQGVQFGSIACHATKGGTARARGEDRILDRLDALAAIRDADLSAEDLHLLALVDYGATRAKGKVEKNGTITPAIEPQRPKDAAEKLRAAGIAMTEHEAKVRLKRARGRLASALHERGLIPAPRKAPARSRAPASDPFAGVGATS
jgi:hypothetical protein